MHFVRMLTGPETRVLWVNSVLPSALTMFSRSWTNAARTSSKWPAAVWRSVSSIATEDDTVRELFDKARCGLAAMVADTGVMNAGIFEYGGQWVRDTAFTLGRTSCR